MTLDFAAATLLDLAWKSALLAGLALGALKLLKRRSAAERACLAHFGLGGLLLLPLTALIGPKLEVELLEPAPALPLPSVVAPLPGEETLPTLSAAEAPMLTADHVITALYAMPALLLVLMTAFAVLRLFALRGRAQVIVEADWLTALAHAQRRMGLKHGTALLVSRELPSPVSWGLMRPVILLSEAAVETAVDAEAIVAHELAHVARRDWLNLLVARIACALFWFNPLIWLLARAAHQLREEAADDAVLNAAVPCTEYAQLLVSAARHEGKGLLLAANGVAPSKSSLAIRVRRILDGSAVRGPARGAWVGTSSLAVIGIAAPLAAFTPVAPPAPVAVAAAPVHVAAPVARPGILAPPAAPAPLAPVVAPAPGAVTALAAAQATAPALRAALRELTPEDVVALRVHGITPGYAAELAAANSRFHNLSSDELVSLRVQGVTPQRLREYAAAGYGDLGYEQVIAMAVHGVSGRYINELAAEGLRGLPADMLLAMRIHGVTPDFVRAMRAEGYGTLSAERLVELRIHGARPRRTPRTPHAPPVPQDSKPAPPPPSTPDVSG